MKKIYHVTKTEAGILGTEGTMKILKPKFTNKKDAYSYMNQVDKKEKGVLYFVEWEWLN